MGNETKKSLERRIKNGDFVKYFGGNGIDIGCGNSPIRDCAVKFDKRFGHNAHDLSNYKDESFDYVYSSHCLEHLEQPMTAIREWWRVLKPSGHLIIVVPNFTLYEKRIFPSKFNRDHKWTFTLEGILGVFSSGIVKNYQVMRVQVNDEGFDYGDKKSDQTTKGAQAEIEIIVKKVTDTFWSDGYMKGLGVSE